MTYIGQFPPATRPEPCMYCGGAVEPGALYAACDRCDTRNLFSDMYKEEVGRRPDLSQWSLRAMREALRAGKVWS
jgi:ribosomal protein L24E